MNAGAGMDRPMDASGGVVYPDAMSAKLRSIVGDIERELVNASAQLGTPAVASLLASWHDLLNTLALGPAPQLRDCPVCGTSGRRAATRCASCWSTLEPLPEGSEGNI